jgi:hypothetical protein
MMCLISLLFRGISPSPASLLGTVTGETYTDQQVLNETTSFVACAFLNCQTATMDWPRNSGGALLLTHTDLGLSLSSCMFVSCRAWMVGGAFLARCLWFWMSDTSGWNCSLVSAFCEVSITSMMSGHLTVLETSATACTATTNVMLFDSSTLPLSGNATLVEGLNSSGNSASDCGSGFYATNHFFLRFYYCQLIGNARRNCITLSSNIEAFDGRCVIIANTTCKSNDHCPGLIFCDSDAVFRDCVFQGNTFDFWIGTFAGDQVTAVFVGCVTDADWAPATNSVAVSSVNCTNKTQTIGLPTCATLSETPSNAQNQSPTESRNQSPIATQNQTPAQTQNQTPTQTQNQTPKETQNQNPTKTQNQTPTQTQNQSPIQKHSPTRTQNESPTWTRSQSASVGPEPRKLLDRVAISAAVAGPIVVGFVVVAIIVHRRRTADQASESMFTPLQSATGAPGASPGSVCCP